MSIVCLKSKNDNRNFRIFKGFGFDVIEIDELENIDYEIEKAIKNNYSTIVISNEAANFSQNIITKYNKIDNVNIIISYK